MGMPRQILRPHLAAPSPAPRPAHHPQRNGLADEIDAFGGHHPCGRYLFAVETRDARHLHRLRATFAAGRRLHDQGGVDRAAVPVVGKPGAVKDGVGRDIVN